VFTTAAHSKDVQQPPGLESLHTPAVARVEPPRNPQARNQERQPSAASLGFSSAHSPLAFRLLERTSSKTADTRAIQASFITGALAATPRVTEYVPTYARHVWLPPSFLSICRALSTGRRNMSMKFVGWSVKPQCLSRSLVELQGYLVEVCLAVAREVGALGEVLAQQAIGVLV
jgi:hypothetical protein